MSQSATLYRVSQETLLQLDGSQERGQFDLTAMAKSYSTFQGSFMGLEFVLSKGQQKETADLIAEIFNPTKTLEAERSNDEDALALYETGEIIYYLDSNTVSRLHSFLNTLSVDQAIASYDSEELNANGIYPVQWKAGFSREDAFNERDIAEGVKQLKDIFEAADLENDSILVFVG
jgi:Domain of unknown function (DUF1877)